MSQVSRPKLGPAQLVAAGLFAVSATGASPQSAQFECELYRAMQHRSLLTSSARDPRRERFARLSREWRQETRRLSSTTEIAMHPAYQEIIGMGPEALPLILEDLRDNSGHWFWALKAISGHDPVPPKDRGAIKKMKAAWLRWGKAKGLVTA